MSVDERDRASGLVAVGANVVQVCQQNLVEIPNSGGSRPFRLLAQGSSNNNLDKWVGIKADLRRNTAYDRLGAMKSPEKLATNIPGQVIESFLEKLAKQDLPTETLASLRRALQEPGGATERAIRAALFEKAEPEL